MSTSSRSPAGRTRGSGGHRDKGRAAARATAADRPGRAPRTGAPSPAAPATASPLAYRALAIATLGFGVNFWAWALIGPLGPRFKESLGLTSVQQAFLVAVPVIVGSLGRIPVGALTDRFGGRVMFPVVSFATIVPVLLLTVVSESYPLLLLTGFFLGIGGTAFAVGVPMVNAWFPPARRGFAIGIFGMGMGGTAVSNFTTVRLADSRGEDFPFLLVAGVLAAFGVLALLFARDNPDRAISTEPFLRRTWETFKLPVTLQMSLLYAVGFGGFVAFSVYLPTYLKTAYELAPTDAANRTAGFVVVAVLARPIGGWLSDRLHPVPVLVGCFLTVALFAVLQAFQPDLAPLGTVTFLVMAAMLGAAAGAVFALVALVAPAGKVGAVTGIVGAAGGLGGFIPPLIMGAVYSAEASYAIGLMLLSDVALASAVYTAVKMGHVGRAAPAPVPAPAPAKV